MGRRMIQLRAACLLVLISAACGSNSQTPAELTCAEFAQCLSACGDSKCEDDCVAKASSTAVDQFNALATCDQTNGCNGESACQDAKCAAPIVACFPGTMIDGGSGDGFPASYVGTVTDNSNVGGIIIESTGTATFVRDDAADPRGTSGMFAFYKLKTITYVSKSSGGAGGCTYSANETVTFTDPPAFENLVAIQKMPSAGAYTYDITTTLSTKRPMALTIACPSGTMVESYNAENNVAAGIPAPTTTSLLNLKKTLMAPGQNRTWAWDLKGM